jgi:hypothetical protein
LEAAEAAAALQDADLVYQIEEMLQVLMYEAFRD